MISSCGLAFAYAGAPALRFPDLQAPQGAVVLLHGPSGSGKSTWLALVAALARPSAGELCVAGQDLAALKGSAADAWRARTIGFLPQRLHLSSALSVFDNLALASWAAGQAPNRARIHASLQALGVAELAARRPTQLSGGQAQRVALARAVLLQPQIILADEPTGNLDDHAAEQAVALLYASAQALAATLVVATHDARVNAALETAVSGNNANQPPKILKVLL